MMALHCDRDGCTRWEPCEHHGKFITVAFLGDQLRHDSECPHEQRHFCGTDCLMFWAAAQPKVSTP